jgi:hypothetical protein
MKRGHFPPTVILKQLVCKHIHGGTVFAPLTGPMLYRQPSIVV